jgi:hypothetical protein
MIRRTTADGTKQGPGGIYGIVTHNSFVFPIQAELILDVLVKSRRYH